MISASSSEPLIPLDSECQGVIKMTKETICVSSHCSQKGNKPSHNPEERNCPVPGFSPDWIFFFSILHL